jgi:hypothetical protein
MKLSHSRLDIGLPKALSFLHCSDNHLCYVDERDDERKQELAARRRRAFERDTNRCTLFLDEMIAYAKEHCDLLLHSGDLIDFVSYRNLEVAKEKLDQVDYFMAVGNHEFSLYVGEAFEDEAYKSQSFARVQAAFNNDLPFASRLIGGLNLVAIDNGYYLFSAEQLARFKAEIAKGYPIVLMLHTPIYSTELYQEMMFNRKKECAFVCDCPAELMDSYSEHRRRAQRADAPTQEFVRHLKEQPLVKAILCGHLHFNHEGILYGDTPQLISGAGYAGEARLISVV